MLHRVVMGEMEPAAVNLHPGSALQSEEVAVSQDGGTAEVAPHLSISFGIGQPAQKLRGNSLPHQPGANHPQAVLISLRVTARGIWSGCLQAWVEVLVLNQAPSACRGGRGGHIRGVHLNRGKTTWATEALGET